MSHSSENPWRADFPLLAEEVRGHRLAYLDNAATTQKPRAVLDRVSGFLAKENANIHRGVYYLSMNATDEYDRARDRVATFLNANSTREIVFVRGTTEAINLVAQSFGRTQIGEGDEILVTIMEHHANFVPWQQLAEARGAKLVVAPISDDGELLVDEFESLLSDRTRLVAFTHVSNALGTINPVKQLTAMAKARGIPVLIDGAQAVPHLPVDVRELGCDFYAFSSHKLYGPDGVGVLWGREDLLEAMPPWQTGGDMIESVTVEKTTFRGTPERFEAGTPNISGAIGLAAAIDYLEAAGADAVRAHEERLLREATGKIEAIEGVRLIGTAAAKVPVISFVIEGVHPHDVGTVFDTEGVCVRAGHHCTMPLMQRLGVTGTTRVSFAFYNNDDDIDRLVAAIGKAVRLFGVD